MTIWKQAEAAPYGLDVEARVFCAQPAGIGGGHMGQLNKELSDLEQRLATVGHRLASLADAIYGPAPQAAGQHPTPHAVPNGTMEHLADRVHSLNETFRYIDPQTDRLQALIG